MTSGYSSAAEYDIAGITVSRHAFITHPASLQEQTHGGIDVMEACVLYKPFIDLGYLSCFLVFRAVLHCISLSPRRCQRLMHPNG